MIENAAWTPDDWTFLGATADVMDETSGLASEARAVRAAAGRLRDREPVRVFLRWSLLAIGSLVGLWLSLFLLYPHFRIVQRLVWSRLFRRASGPGLVGPLIAGNSRIRALLWRPFRENLVPPEEVQTFDDWTFFESIRVAPAGDAAGGPRPALATLEAFRGINLLQGASGLGKSTLLQCLAFTARRPVAYLRAIECKDGILASLQARLPAALGKNGAFLQALVRRGSPALLIEAVHEVSPAGRIRLAAEAAALSGSDILFTAQPGIWMPPEGSRVWDLLPLRTEDVAGFLLQQGSAMLAGNATGPPTLKQAAFAARIDAFLNPQPVQPDDDPAAAARRQMLTNPMDAVLAAEILASGEIPVPARLVEQRLVHLVREFESERGEPFPVAEFAAHLREWRLSGAPSLHMDRFPELTSFLARNRLVRKGSAADAGWRFRHDRILDWFLNPALAGMEGSATSAAVT